MPSNPVKAFALMGEACEEALKYNLRLSFIEATIAFGRTATIQMSNFETARVYTNRALEMCDEGEDRRRHGYLLMNLANLCVSEGDILNGLEYIRKAEETSNAIDDEDLKIMIINNRSHLCYMLAQYDKAMEYLLQTIEYQQRVKNPLAVANCHNNLANIYLLLERKDKALEQYLLAKSLYEQENDVRGMIRIYTNIAVYYTNSGDVEEALRLEDLALVLSRQHGFDFCFCNALLNKGNTLNVAQRASEAEGFLREAVSIAKNNGYHREFMAAANNLGETLANLTKFDEALQYLDLSLKTSQQLGDNQLIIRNYFLRAQVLRSMGRLDEAVDSLWELIHLKDKVYNDDVAKRINSMQIQFEVAQKEREAEIYRLKNQELAEANRKLQEALDRVKALSGLVPICAHCKKIRDDKGFWNHLETYISMHSDAQFSHGICPDCMQLLYPDFIKREKMKS